MGTQWMTSVEAMAGRAAWRVVGLIQAKPTATVALPTGSTPLVLYERLRQLHEAGDFSCPRARFFNLDEFVGKSANEPPSFGAQLWQHVFRPLRITADRVRLLTGDAPDLSAECIAFEAAIRAAGGLDLAILGVGVNGHIAFNEPFSDWNSVTREVELADSTRSAQVGLFPTVAEVPRHALTIGMRTIIGSRSILLLVSGVGKEAVMKAILRGTPDMQWPVTAILRHPNLTILADHKLNPARPD